MHKERIRDELAKVHEQFGALNDAVVAFRVDPKAFSPKIDPEWLIKGSICSSLQALYSGIELVLETILKSTDGFRPAGDQPNYHKQILDRAAGVVDGIRPKIISEDLRKLLDHLRGFRHIARKRYAQEVDLAAALKNFDRAATALPMFVREIDDFLAEMKGPPESAPPLSKFEP